MPAYPSILDRVGPLAPKAHFADLFGGAATVLAAQAHGLQLLLLDAPHLYDRPGGPYIGLNGYDHTDNWARFAALGKAAAEIGLGAIDGWRPDIVHAHDWQGALAPVTWPLRKGRVRAPSSPSTTLLSRARFRTRSCRRLACRTPPGPSRASNITARSAS